MRATGITIHLPEGEDTNGLGQVMSQYIEQNCADFPGYATRARQLNKCVTINASDVDVQATLDFRDGGLTVHSGSADNSDMTLSGEWIVMTDIAAGKRYGPWEGLCGRVSISPTHEAFFGARKLFNILRVPREYLEARGIEMPPWRILHPTAFTLSVGAGAVTVATGIMIGMEQC